MNNIIGLLLGITDDSDPKWKYINLKGHVVTCTKKQFQSHFRNQKLDHKEVMKRAVDTLFAPNPWYYKLKKEEVRKAMAIDYKKQWEKLHATFGRYGLCKEPGTTMIVRLDAIMDDQIRNAINDREKLMKEFIRARITTDISDSKEQHHEVQIYINGLPRGRYLVSKLEFAAWCKKKEKGGK